MGTEDFSHIKPVVQSGGGDIRLVSQAWGEPVDGVGLVGDVGGNIQPAGLFSTAPYVPSEPKVDRTGMCKGKLDTCTNKIMIRPNGYCPGCDLARIRREKASA